MNINGLAVEDMRCEDILNVMDRHSFSQMALRALEKDFEELSESPLRFYWKFSPDLDGHASWQVGFCVPDDLDGGFSVWDEVDDDDLDLSDYQDTALLALNGFRIKTSGGALEDFSNTPLGRAVSLVLDNMLRVAGTGCIGSDGYEYVSKGAA